MKKNSLSQNFIFYLVYQILLYIVPLVTTPYLSRVLGAEGIGRYSFAQSIVSYFVLAATLGTTLYGQRKIASLKTDPAAQTQAFWQIFLLRVVTTAVALAVYGVVVLPACGAPVLYLVSAIELLGVAFDISWFFQGEESFATITKCNGICKILSVALIFLLVRTAADLNMYVVIYCGMTVAGNLAQWTFVPRYLQRGAVVRPLAFGQHLKPALGLFVAQVAIQVYTVLDKTMIGVITRSDAQNGYYEQAQKLIRVLTTLTTSIGTVMASRVAILWREEKYDEIEKMLQTSFRVIFCLACPVVVGVLLVAERFVPIFYGNGFEEVVPLLYILVFLIPIIGISNVIGMQYLVPTGKETYLTRSVMIGSIVNVGFNAFLIPRFGALGAAIASVIAETCVPCIQAYTVHEVLNFKPIGRLFVRYCLCSAPVAVLGEAINGIAPQGIWGLVIVVIPCIAVYLLELAFLKDPALKFVFSVFAKNKS
ncbi:flippase [uncultured Gemmiger sp.]|uniref:flippase n=1 Tax=uncultured Gemmiger sp. TaxID=1623490 RepID=UPI00260125AC|nr:flippase [uncultured Gemmiger sp.]